MGVTLVAGVTGAAGGLGYAEEAPSSKGRSASYRPADGNSRGKKRRSSIRLRETLDRALKDLERFWGEAVLELYWFKPWNQVLESKVQPTARRLG